MGARVKVELTEEQAATLWMWAGAGKIGQRMALRAKVVLLAAEGLGLKEIEAETALNWQSCLKWRKRFLAYGLDGLKDQAGRGRPQSITREERGDVVALAGTTPADGSRRWSVRKLAEATGHSKSAVQKILAEGALDPHKTAFWRGRSPDQGFEQKRMIIAGLYLNLSERALVLSVEATSQCRVLFDQAAQPSPALRSDVPKQLAGTSSPHGPTSLLAALATQTGSVARICAGNASKDEFLKFLRSLYRKSPGTDLHMIVNILAVHNQRKIEDWGARKRRVTMHGTPTVASWLNQVETWFNILARDVPRGGIWFSKQQLVGQIMEYVRNGNGLRTKSFKWANTDSLPVS